MLYHRVSSLRPWAFATTVRRVWKKNSSASTATWVAKQVQFVASKRCYGTTVSKPRVATSTTTASKATQTDGTKKKVTARKTTTVAKAAAKKPAKKAAPKPKKKKPVAKKVVAKKPTKRLPTKKLLKEQAKEKLDGLKKRALLDEPKKKKHSNWLTFTAEFRASNAYTGSDLPPGLQKERAMLLEASKQFKALLPADIERLNEKNKLVDDAQELEYKKWLSSHTPTQIRDANAARIQLRIMERQKRKEGKSRSITKYPAIEDERLPKPALSGFQHFMKEKWDTGAFNDITIADSSKLAGAEWKVMSADEKKVYQDRSQADHVRKDQEKQTVFQA